METAPSTVRLVKFGVFEVDLRAEELRKGGLKLKLTGQPFQVLALLLERPGDVVTRDEIQKRLWPDGTFVNFDHNLNAAINKIREVLGDSAENPRFVETLPRRGYRFIAPVEPPNPSPARPGEGPVGAGAVREPPLQRRWKWAAAGIAALALCLTAAAFFYLRFLRGPTNAIDSIAVLPFANASGDPNTEYLSDGITEGIINSLSQLPNLAVKSRNLVMHYKGRDADAQGVGREW